MNNSIMLDPNFFTGFCDAEGSFMVHIDFPDDRKWRVTPSFSIHLNKKDLPLLKSIQSFLGGVGLIYSTSNGMVIYRVTKFHDIAKVIIPHFSNYPLLTQKQADFLLFKKVVSIVQTGGHLTEKGLQKIISIKASMNRGLNAKVANAYPGVKPIRRPTIKQPSKLVGFVTGDGSFSVSSNETARKAFRVRFFITQHARDLKLLGAIQIYFGGIGSISQTGSGFNYAINSYKDCYNVILPFFIEHAIPSVAFKHHNLKI